MNKINKLVWRAFGCCFIFLVYVKPYILWVNFEGRTINLTNFLLLVYASINYYYVYWRLRMYRRKSVRNYGTGQEKLYVCLVWVQFINWFSPLKFVFILSVYYVAFTVMLANVLNALSYTHTHIHTYRPKPKHKHKPVLCGIAEYATFSCTHSITNTHVAARTTSTVPVHFPRTHLITRNGKMKTKNNK